MQVQHLAVHLALLQRLICMPAKETETCSWVSSGESVHSRQRGNVDDADEVHALLQLLADLSERLLVAAESIDGLHEDEVAELAAAEESVELRRAVVSCWCVAVLEVLDALRWIEAGESEVQQQLLGHGELRDERRVGAMDACALRALAVAQVDEDSRIRCDYVEVPLNGRQLSGAEHDEWFRLKRRRS